MYLIVVSVEITLGSSTFRVPRSTLGSSILSPNFGYNIRLIGINEIDFFIECAAL